MNNYNELIGQLVEYRTETWENEPNPVALGLIVEATFTFYEDPYIRVEWLVNPHD